MLKEISLHWGAEHRAERSSAPDDPLWLLTYASELYSAGLRNTVDNTSPVSKLNILLSDQPPSTGSSVVSHVGIVEVVLYFPLYSLKIESSVQAVDLGLDLISRATQVLIREGLLSADARIAAMNFVMSHGHTYQFHFVKKKLNGKRMMQLSAIVKYDHLEVYVSGFERAQTIFRKLVFKTWPSLGFLKLRLIDIEVAGKSLRLCLSDEWCQRNDMRFDVRRVEIERSLVWLLEKYNFRGRDRVSIVTVDWEKLGKD